jgi:tRNA A37 threonylcarbamoyladenosine dehydratase
MKDFNHDDYNQRFGGMARLYGVVGLKNLLKANVLVVGLGGVGSWAAEALARSGVGSITIVDLDDICITNTNRQLPAMNGNFGKLKVEVVKERLLAINPQCEVLAIANFFTENTAESILDKKFDYVIDAIDSLTNKALLTARCLEKNLPIIVTGGTAGKINPTLIKISDLSLSDNDSLLFRLRRKLRKEEVLPKVPMEKSSSTKNRKKLNITCVFSSEEPVYPTKEGGVCHIPDSETNLKMDCETGMGSVAHITGLFGLVSAGHVINAIAHQN